VTLLQKWDLYYPPPPVPAKPVADREAFGSTALEDFLRCNPDAFELSRHGLPGAADDFRAVFHNINGLDSFKPVELLAFMSSASVDCLVLIDARVPKHQAKFCLRETTTELGPGEVCLVSSPTDASGSTPDGSEKPSK